MPVLLLYSKQFQALRTLNYGSGWDRRDLQTGNFSLAVKKFQTYKVDVITFYEAASGFKKATYGSGWDGCDL